MSRCLTLATFAAMGFASIASSQVLIYNQPWSSASQEHSVESRVQACPTSSTTPATQIAGAHDDFTVSANWRLQWIDVWGSAFAATSALQQSQLARRYYVAIYATQSGTTCTPARVPIYQTCIRPVAIRRRGFDCQDVVVYQMRFRLPAAVPLVARRKYWLQVSEIDRESVNVGTRNWQWSLYRTVVACPAGRKTPNGWFPGYVDRCDNVRSDLAFALYR